MKRSLLLFSLFCFISLTINSQFAWDWQYPEPQGNTLQSISYCDNQNGFAVGYLGTIIQTSNSGDNWVTQVSGTDRTLFDVICVNQNVAYIVGSYGTIIKTIDAGNNWYIQASGTDEDLRSVYFVDELNGMAVGSNGTILRTIDGGLNWVQQDCGSTSWFFGVHLIDANHGSIVGENGKIYTTINGGEAWMESASGVSYTLGGVSFYNNEIGFIAGYGGTVLRTTDGGNSWTEIAENMTSKNLYDVHASDADHITIVGKDKSVILMTDNGNSWTLYHQVGDNHFYGASNENIVGTGGQIFRTDNYGEDWIEQKEGKDYDLNAVSFGSDNKGIAVGDHGTILATTNGGDSWNLKTYNSPSINGSINDYLQDIDMYTSSSAIAVCGYNVYNSGVGFFSDGLILKSTNSGNSWSVKYHTEDANYYGVSFADNNRGIAVGLYSRWESNEYNFHSSYSITSNGGSSWNHLYFTSILLKLNDASYINSQIIIVGESGRILRSINDGESFSTITSGTTEDLNAISFADQNHGFIVGSNGVLLKSTNGGSSWNSINLGINIDLFDVRFIDTNNGIISGEGGLVIRSTDGGLSWFACPIPYSYNMYGATLASNEKGIVVGKYGVILSTNNAGAINSFENIGICEGDSYEGWTSSGTYSRNLVSSIGVDSLITTYLVVNQVPEKPSIHITEDTLISSSIYGNQWYFNDAPIAGATNQKLKVTDEGDYYVVATNTAACSSPQSETINYISSIYESWINKVTVFPSPTRGLIHIEELPVNERIEINIIDLFGKSVYTKTNQGKNVEIDLSQFSDGMYILEIKAGVSKRTKILKN